MTHVRVLMSEIYRVVRESKWFRTVIQYKTYDRDSFTK